MALGVVTADDEVVSEAEGLLIQTVTVTTRQLQLELRGETVAPDGIPGDVQQKVVHVVHGLESISEIEIFNLVVREIEKETKCKFKIDVLGSQDRSNDVVVEIELLELGHEVKVHVDQLDLVMRKVKCSQFLKIV